MTLSAAFTLMAIVLIAPHLPARYGAWLGLLFALLGFFALVAALPGRAA